MKLGEKFKLYAYIMGFIASIFWSAFFLLVICNPFVWIIGVTFLILSKIMGN